MVCPADAFADTKEYHFVFAQSLPFKELKELDGEKNLKDILSEVLSRSKVVEGKQKGSAGQSPPCPTVLRMRVQEL